MVLSLSHEWVGCCPGPGPGELHPTPSPYAIPLKPALEAKRSLAAISKDCLRGKQHLVSDGENVPWQRSSLNVLQER